jgi:hypothetical protein
VRGTQFSVTPLYSPNHIAVKGVCVNPASELVAKRGSVGLG